MSRRQIYFEDVEWAVSNRDLEDDNISEYEKSLRLRLLSSVLDTNLTKKQKCYIMLYYKENKKISEIARKFGVLPSTVSRTINRARKNLYKAVTGRELFTRFSPK
ncbi:MAG: helix-turn-helix domain-containing protein [Ruminococcus sp.]|nr:helix-turn-helix domain-containing protein [Ruminococcus sp.]